MHNQTATDPCTLLIPTADMVAELGAGDLALNAFGKLAEVTEVTCRGTDLKGRAFVHYYTATEAGGSMSMSMKVGELVRHAGTSRYFTSAQLGAIALERGGF